MNLNEKTQHKLTFKTSPLFSHLCSLNINMNTNTEHNQRSKHFPCSLRLRSLDLCRYDELVAQGIDLEQETTDDTTDTEGTAASATVAVETKEDGDKAERAESDRLRSSSTTSNSRQLSTASTTAGGLVEEEERSTGDVDSKAYWHYLYSMGWG